jgi:hypothetical protein
MPRTFCSGSPTNCQRIHFADTFPLKQTFGVTMADNLFVVCEPRADVLQGALKESDFAADLSQVLRGDAPEEYRKPVCWRRSKFDPPCRLNFDPGLGAGIA